MLIQPEDFLKRLREIDFNISAIHAGAEFITDDKRKNLTEQMNDVRRVYIELMDDGCYFITLLPTETVVTQPGRMFCDFFKLLKLVAH